MNKEKLRACVRYFEEEPLRFNMSTWVDTISSTDHHVRNYYKSPPCGTVACLVGSAMILEAKALGKEKWFDVLYNNSESYEDFGMRYFELDNKEQAEALFYASRWPLHYATLYETFADDFFKCRHPHLVRYIKQKMVQILEMRIEFFIRTNGTDDETPQY